MASTKASTGFKDQIKDYLNALGANDPLFSETLKKEGKSLDGCINYIFDTVQKSGNNGYADDEIYAMAVHYYDEDGIEVKTTPSNMRVVVNHVVELSQAEKDEAHKKALDNAIAQEQARISKKPVAKKPTTDQQPSLF